MVLIVVVNQTNGAGRKVLFALLHYLTPSFSTKHARLSIKSVFGFNMGVFFV